MTGADDITLLREFAERQSESAFTELVRRHLNLVYCVALRFVRDSDEAQDVSQSVFVLLAQKAGTLRGRGTLTGWLYETTRFTAMKSLRTRARRAAREKEATTQSMLNDSNGEDLWQRLEPLLEDAMTRLSEKDRALIALHFFENKTHAETAAALGIAEWATRKRVARAVEKLRAFFGRRGVVVPAAVLMAVISANSVRAAPAALAKTVTVAAMAKGAATSASTLTLIKGAVKIMTWTKTKVVVVVSVAVMLAAGTTTTLVVKHVHRRTTADATPAFAAGGTSSARTLQGRWRGTNTAHPGKVVRVTISGDKIEYRGADADDWLRGTFVVNDNASPAELNITVVEPVRTFILCLYQADGDKFTVAAAEHGKRLRPADFTPVHNQVDVLELQRD